MEPEPEPEPLENSMVTKTKRKAGFLRGAMGRTDPVTAYLFVGGKASAQDKLHLQELGITHVINATANMANAFPDLCTYLRVAVPDTEATNLARHFTKAVDFIDGARTAGGKVLVHCSAGMSRSVTLVLAYLLTCPNSSTGTPESIGGGDSAHSRPMRLLDAFRLVKSRRTIVAPNPAFMRQLCEYEMAEQKRWNARGGGGGAGPAGLCPSLDIDKYAANRFGKCDSYVIDLYQTTLDE